MQRMSWSVLVSRLLLGALTFGFGMLVGLERIGIIALGPIQNLWPMAVLAAGLAFFAEPPGRGISMTGLWLVALGAWLVMNGIVGNLLGHWVGPLGAIVRGAWPVLFIVAGAGMSIHTLIVVAASGIGDSLPVSPLTTTRFMPRLVPTSLTTSRPVREGRNGR